MKNIKTIFIFFMEEWLLSISIIALLISSIYIDRLPYLISSQLIPIFFLFVLFVSIKGIEKSGFLIQISRYFEQGTFLAPKLVLTSFLLSILLSIDITLISMLPLILMMQIKEKNYIVLLVAFSAHVGAALTPFGTPQNLFIFSFYQIDIFTYIKTIAPFSFLFFCIFFIISFFIKTEIVEIKDDSYQKVFYKEATIYIVFLFIVILTILKLLPWYMGFTVLIYSLVKNRAALKVDYPLLLTFVIFLALANNLKMILYHYLEHPTHIFILSSLLSQFISNVPTTLLLHQFTTQWKALLWGTNVGGFGTPVAALANLITYRIYYRYQSKKQSNIFLKQMIFWGVILYFIGIGLYLMLDFLNIY